MWLCDANTAHVLTADLNSGVTKDRFQSNGCFDGLSYDSTDDTVWASGDVDSTVTHYKTDGTVLGTMSITGKLGACGYSGLAAGATELFLANNGCSEIYRIKKDGTGSTRVGGYPARLEDLECDDITFPGTTVIWSKDAYDRQLNAFDVGAIDCGLNSYRDSDADGISDTWEAQGADIDGNGTIDLDLPAMGADPLHKDLFVEIDWFAKDARKVGPISLGGGYTYPPSTSAATRVTNAFKNWPVPNPDGKQGINLHLDAGANSIMNLSTGEKWGSKSRSSAIKGAADVSTWATWGTMDELRRSNVDNSRQGVFHYVLYAPEIEACSAASCTTGLSRGVPGHDLLMARKVISTDTQEAVTLAHELGHNLGLGHGGRERIDDPGSRHVNEKANYISIMNYFYSNTGLKAHNATDGIIQYSSVEHDPLAANNLDESIGLNPDPFGHFDVRYRCKDTGADALKWGDSWTGADWNCDGAVADGSTSSKLQSASDVSDWKADPQLVRGSENYHHLYFWGTGSTWDARNVAMSALNQPGTKGAHRGCRQARWGLVA